LRHDAEKPAAVQGTPFVFVRISGERRGAPSKAACNGPIMGREQIPSDPERIATTICFKIKS
jgi:hypothetical protein